MSGQFASIADCRSLRTAAVALAAASFASAQHTERVSLATSGAEPNNQSLQCTISNDGRYVAFASYASNLAAVDINNSSDIFVRDRQLNTTTLIDEKFGSPGTTPNNVSGGATYPRITGNGRYVVFVSGATDMTSPLSAPSLWRKDLVTGVLESASVAADGSINHSPGFGYFQVSTTGRFVVWASGDGNVVPGDTNNSSDIFIRDFQAATTVRASLYSDGTQFAGGCINPSISDDGRWVLFVGAAPLITNDAGNPHLLLKDMQTGTLSVVDVSAGGAVGNGLAQQARLTPDGHYAVWQNNASNLYVDPFYDNPIVLKDLTTGTYESIAINDSGVPANNTVAWPAVSSDGRYVSFMTSAANLGTIPVNSGIFVRDRVAHTTRMVSLSTAGAIANNTCQIATISSDGRYVAYETMATNLDSPDTNANWDIYLRDRFSGGTFGYCVAQMNSIGCTPHMSSSGTPSASAGSGFTLSCANVMNKKPGLMFYGTNGSQAVPFTGGYLCVRSPTIRMPAQNSGGSPTGSDCTGQFSLDFNVRIASGLDPNLVVGRDVCAQFWSRDPGAPSLTNLSDAVSFTIQP